MEDTENQFSYPIFRTCLIQKVGYSQCYLYYSYLIYKHTFNLWQLAVCTSSDECMNSIDTLNVCTVWFSRNQDEFIERTIWKVVLKVCSTVFGSIPHTNFGIHIGNKSGRERARGVWALGLGLGMRYGLRNKSKIERERERKKSFVSWASRIMHNVSKNCVYCMLYCVSVCFSATRVQAFCK